MHNLYRKLLHISYEEHKTNNDVRQKISIYAGKHKPLPAIVKRQKVSWLPMVGTYFKTQLSVPDLLYRDRWKTNDARSTEEILDGQH